ncbi:MAG: hypothetical protein ABIH34_02275 [Nanoarchaeota archaeon]
MTAKEDTLELGGNIRLVGFRELDSSTLIVLKKIVGNTVKRFSEKTTITELALVMKRVHEREKSEIYELKANLICKGKNYAAAIDDRNLFFAVDKVMKKLEAEAFGK